MISPGRMNVVNAMLVSCLTLLLLSCGGSSSSTSHLTGIDISPLSQTTGIGGTVQYTATGHFDNGPDQDLTVNTTWSSSATSVATINNLGTLPGLATGVAPGTTTITASFAQGTSSVQASTDLTVVAGVPIPPGHVGRASVPVSFRRASPVSTGSVNVDGHAVSAFVNNELSLELPAGAHRFSSSDGRYTFSIELAANRSYSFAVLASGELVLLRGRRAIMSRACRRSNRCEP